jgi:hypothetical protein
MKKNMRKKINKEKMLYSGITRTITMIVVFVIIAFVILISVLFFKVRSVYLNVMSGRQDIFYAIESMAEGEFHKASLSASRATESFTIASEILDDLKNNFFTRNISFVDDNINDFKLLAQTAQILSSSVENSIFLVRDLEGLFSGDLADSFLDLSEEDRISFLKTFYEGYPEMQGIKANIDLALVYLSKSKNNRFLSAYQGKIDSLRSQLKELSAGLESVISISSIIPIVAGYPEPVSYLVILQNNHELRPTGGFIGTYGILEIGLGDVTRIETHDIYHIDMPASLNESFRVSPPDPIRRYIGTERWFMRDANWSPDWPTTAQKLLWFYEQEMIAAERYSELFNFSGVVALNPRTITDLLYIVGPISIDGNVYDKDNFMDILQYEVDMGFREDGVSEWDRKLVIGEILKELQNRLFSLPSERWHEVLDTFNQNVSRKNILVYLDDEYSREMSSNLNWSGELKKSPADYLMVVDANLAAFKTDRVMEKNIKYFLNETEENNFRAKVESHYKNNGWFDWQTTRYRTFTRVYTPYGSQLINSSGISDLNAVSFNDSEILNPKTYFGGFISIEPGSSGVLSFEYNLPDHVSDFVLNNNSYFLKTQIQPGSNVSNFEALMSFSRKVKDIKGDGFFEIKDDNTVYWSHSMEKDNYLEVIFK